MMFSTQCLIVQYFRFLCSFKKKMLKKFCWNYLWQVTTILKEAGHITPNLGELGAALKARLGDSNKLLVSVLAFKKDSASVFFWFFLPIHRSVLALYTQYFPESCEKISQACYSGGIRITTLTIQEQRLTN